MGRLRAILWGLVAIASIGAGALYFGSRPAPPPLAVTGTAFTLHSTAGGDFTERDLQGMPSLVFFGYTSCPDVCPTTLAEAVALRAAAGLTPAQMRIIFVTVDPKRDTKELLTSYLGAFDPAIIGLYGDASATEAAKQAFAATSKSHEPDAQGAYLVDHTASLFLSGRDGSFAGTIAFGEARDAALQKITRLAGS